MVLKDIDPAKLKITLLLTLAGLLTIGAVAIYVVATRPLPSERGCTLEAKICPDGSAVGRTGPNCAFSPCPGE